MGWTDREPYFSMIQSRMDLLVEQGVPRHKAYDQALEDVTEVVREAADALRDRP